MTARGAELEARSRLDAALIAAHAAEDWKRLVGLYAEAADDAHVQGQIDAACFYLTHAYVFALQTGDPCADELHRRLMDHGREE